MEALPLAHFGPRIFKKPRMATPSPDSTVFTVAVQIEEQLPEELLNETFVKNASLCSVDHVINQS